jgi:hypothetical protein
LQATHGIINGYAWWAAFPDRHAAVLGKLGSKLVNASPISGRCFKAAINRWAALAVCVRSPLRPRSSTAVQPTGITKTRHGGGRKKLDGGIADVAGFSPSRAINACIDSLRSSQGFRLIMPIP